jgi:5'-nucleotidase
MKILLTNDDGIQAPGLVALAVLLSAENDLTIAAPDIERSGVSHALTISRPIFVSETIVADRMGFAVSGLPADCVKLGIDRLVKNRPDLVVSGINRGANTGVNIFYSGTVAAAIEATFAGIPAIAVSIDSFAPLDYLFSAQFVANLIRIIQNQKLPGNIVLNINIPDLPESRIQGVRLTRQSRRRYKDRYLRRQTPNGKPYYWLDGDAPEQMDDERIDDCALAKGWISITPLSADFNLAETGIGEITEWIERVDLHDRFCLLR